MKLAAGATVVMTVSLAINRPSGTDVLRIALLGLGTVVLCSLLIFGLRGRSEAARRGAAILVMFAALGATGYLTTGTRLSFSAGFTALFVYIGLRFKPGSTLVFLPIGIGCWLVANQPIDVSVWSRLPLAAGTWLLVGELLAAHLRDLGRARDKLQVQAERDNLTGLFNRHVLAERLEGLVPGDAVIFVDLDHFKKVNDLFGHAAGDAILQDLGRVCLSILRKRDTAYRYGGEEILLVLPGADTMGAERALQRLSQGWAASHQEITFSAGTAIVDEHGGTEAAARADQALYEAKRSGRNRWVHDRGDYASMGSAASPTEHYIAERRSQEAIETTELQDELR